MARTKKNTALFPVSEDKAYGVVGRSYGNEQILEFGKTYNEARDLYFEYSTHYVGDMTVKIMFVKFTKYGTTPEYSPLDPLQEVKDRT